MGTSQKGADSFIKPFIESRTKVLQEHQNMEHHTRKRPKPGSLAQVLAKLLEPIKQTPTLLHRTPAESILLLNPTTSALVRHI
ncbi:hypothetical protein M8J77_020613 [Diaphorina citri]|nr:hypothetical protein M8J77_020613 [Diaphorina citri]